MQYGVLARVHKSLLELVESFTSPDESAELISAIMGWRRRARKSKHELAVGDCNQLGRLPFVSILQCTPEMVREVFAEDPARAEREVGKLEVLHRKTKSHERLRRVEKVLKPGEPWELDRQAKLVDFKHLLRNPLRGDLMK
jgi:hypothetical protein